MADKSLTGVAVGQPIFTPSASRAEEKGVVTACLDSSKKKSLSFALQRQHPMCDRTWHSSSARITSKKGSNSCGSSSTSGNPNECASGAMEGEATAGLLKTEEASLRRASPSSKCSAVKIQAFASNAQQKSTFGSNSTAARKAGCRGKPTDPFPSAASSSSSSVRGGLSSNKRSISATMMAESAKHSLVCSLLMPDGITVRKPPPLGIASGDPVGTHILRKRATSMRTENFSSSGLNLSLHRRVGGNNSMLSWQRSFKSTPRGASSSFCFPSSASGSFSYKSRARGGSFMGRPIETLPRLVAFSPSLSKALNQQIHLLPAPPRVDSEEAGLAAANPASVSPGSAALLAAAAADAAPRPPAAAGASPGAAAATPEVANVSSVDPWAQAVHSQDKEAERTFEATDFTRLLRDQASAAGALGVTAAAAQEEQEAKAAGDTRGAGPDVLADETLTTSCCICSIPSRISFSSAVDSSSSAFLVRRRAGCSIGKVLKTNQGTYTELDHPTDILSDTTVVAGSSGSGSSRSESSSNEGNYVTSSKDGGIHSGASSIRSHTCWPPTNEHARRGVLPEGVKLSLPLPDDAAAVEGAGAHATISSAFRAPPSVSSSSGLTETTGIFNVASLMKDASLVSPYVKRACAQEEVQGEQHWPPLSPARLYQLGIMKFIEGKTPEAIEAITHFLRDAVAQKRQQRMAGRSTTSPKQQCALSVSTIENTEEQRGGREGVSVSSSSAGASLSTTATDAATVEKQPTDRKDEISPLPRVSSAEDIAGGVRTRTVIFKGQGTSSFVSTSAPLSPSSPPPDVAAVSTDEPVLSEAVASAPGGETPGAVRLEEAGVLQAAAEETEQQQEREKAQLQMQGDQRPEGGKASEEGDGTAQRTNAREGEAVTREEEHLSPVLLQSDATASRMPCPGLQLQGDGIAFQEKAICEGSVVEEDTDSQVNSTTTVTLFADGTSTQPAAVRAAAAEITTAIASGAPLGGAPGGAAPEETKKQHICSFADRVKEAVTFFSRTGSLDQVEPMVEEDGHLKERMGGDSKATRDDNRAPAVFKEQEPVPIQRLYGVVLGRRMQIDRRAKDLIAGWGAPQYLQLEKLLGHLLFEEGEYPEAVRHYWRCIDLRPDDSQLYTNLGLAYYEMGATEEAIASFDQALKYNDRNTVALSVLAVLLMDAFELSEEELTQKEAENAGEEEFTCDETLRLKRLREGTDRCMTLLKRCVEVEGDNMLSVLHLAQVYMYREEWDEAEAIFKSLLQDNSDDTHLLNNLGQIAMNKGATQEALQLFERVLQINPQDEVAHMHMCEALCTLQHLGRALQHFCLCCEASPDSVSLHATCGLPLCEAGKEKEVVAAYTNFIKQHPGSVAAKTFKRSLGSAGDQVGFFESSQIIMFIVLDARRAKVNYPLTVGVKFLKPILLLIIVLVGFTHLISYWSSPADDRQLPPSWESIYYPSPPDKPA